MNMSCDKCKRTDLTLAQKLEIIAMASKVTQTELSQHFDCAQSTISKVLRQLDQLMKDAAENMMSD